MIENGAFFQEKLRLLRTAEALVESGSSKLCGLKTAEALPQSGVEVMCIFGNCDCYSPTISFHR